MDHKPKPSPLDRFAFWTDETGDWHWQRRSMKGYLVGASPVSFKDREDCVIDARKHGYLGGG